MTKQKLLDLVPLLMLTSALIFTLIATKFSVDYFDIQHLVGLALTVIAWLIYWTYIKGYKTILGLILLLGTVNLIKFLPVTITFGGGLSGQTIELQLFSFLVLLVFSYINRQRLKQIIRDLIKDKPLTEIERLAQREEKIKGFKLKYKDKSINELTRISNSVGTFDNEAVEAAKKLLSEKIGV